MTIPNTSDPQPPPAAPESRCPPPPPGQRQPADEARSDECKRERDSAFETLNKDQAEYDKQLLTLSAAFLGVALAFVKDVVPLRDAVHLCVFDCALVFLLLCVFFVLGTLQYSIHGHLRLAEYWELEKKRLGANEEDQTDLTCESRNLQKLLKRRSDRIRYLNIASGIFFALGVILVVAFVMINMHREAHLSLGVEWICRPSCG